MSLDKEISDAFALLGVLLVFVLGYFSALFPLVQALLDQQTPDVRADRDALANRLATYRILVGGVLLLAVATCFVVGPLTVRVVAALSLHGRFETVRAGLLLVAVMLLALLAVTSWLFVRIRTRINELRAP